MNIELGTQKPYTNNFLGIIYYMFFGIIASYFAAKLSKKIVKSISFSEKT